MNYRFLSLLIVIALLLGACSPQQVIPVQKNKVVVRNINDTSTFIGDAFVYALPKSIIKVDVEIKKTVTKRGPFYKFADQYLGIKDVAQRDLVTYDISDIRIGNYSVPDPNHFYRVETEGNSVASYLSLDEKGLIMAVNQTSSQLNDVEKTDVLIDLINHKDISYGELRLEENIGTLKDTIFKTVKTDTSFIKVPILKNQIGTKTLQSNAKEAADFILKLRKRRFYVITGKYGVIPEGAAMTVVLEELKQLEEDYLSLFMGKTYYEKEKFSYEYTPASGVSSDGKVLFKFSVNQGILKTSATEGDPVRIVINSKGNLYNLDQYSRKIQTNNNIEDIGLVYRIPDYADIELNLSNKTIARKKIIIPQFGKIMHMPAEVLKDSLYTIEFYPETGGLKSIRMKN
ncbi:DUF4831 family protein [Bacteroidota bacterium]